MKKLVAAVTTVGSLLAASVAFAQRANDIGQRLVSCDAFCNPIVWMNPCASLNPFALTPMCGLTDITLWTYATFVL